MNIKDVKAIKKLIEGKLNITILGLLLLLNLPLIVVICKDKYTIRVFYSVITYSIVLQMYEASFISKFVLRHYFKIVDKGQKLLKDSLQKSYEVIFTIILVAFYIISMYFVIKGEFNPGLFGVYAFNFQFLFERQGYFGENYILYRNFVIGIDKILSYKVITKRKYSNNRRDKIQLKLQVIGTNIETIVIYNSKIAYALKDELDKWNEKKFVEDKMKEYKLL